MTRIAVALFVLLLAAPVLAADQTWRTAPGATGTKASLGARGESAYVRNPDATDDTSTALDISGCSAKGKVKVIVIPDITDRTDHADTAEISVCNGQATARTHYSCKKATTRPDGSATFVSAFDGDESTGTEGVYGITGGKIFIEWLSKTAGTGEVWAQCVGG